MAKLLTEPDYLDGILIEGAERAHAIADPILKEAQDIVGFLRP